MGARRRNGQNETLEVGRRVWAMTPDNFVLDDTYLAQTLPIVERQLGLAGLRLARFLNDAFAANQCASQ
jgi:hypothetical protein